MIRKKSTTKCRRRLRSAYERYVARFDVDVEKKESIKSQMQKLSGKQVYLLRESYIAIPQNLSQPDRQAQAIQTNKYFNLYK